MEEKDLDILEFLISSDFDDLDYSINQYIFFLKRYQKYYKLLNAKYHGVVRENEKYKGLEEKIKELELKHKRDRSIDKAKISNLKKELNKKLSWKERFSGKLINRFDPDNI